MECDFLVRFNKGRQFFEVYLWDVHPTTFAAWGGGRWGYWTGTRTNDRLGKFGEVHFVKNRLRFDTIVHELDHVRTDWMWSRGETITRRNEERYACFLDEIVRKFVRELRKREPKIKL
jgi:hypothetical protein